MKKLISLIGYTLACNLALLRADGNESFKAQKEHLQQDRAKLHEKLKEREQLSSEIKTLRKEMHSEREALKNERKEWIKKHREEKEAEREKRKEEREQIRKNFHEGEKASNATSSNTTSSKSEK